MMHGVISYQGNASHSRSETRHRPARARVKCTDHSPRPAAGGTVCASSWDAAWEPFSQRSTYSFLFFIGGLVVFSPSFIEM